MTKKNPKWVRDEVLLAMDLLFNSEDKNFSVKDERIKELSILLQSLPIIPIDERNKYFRNFAGVRRQLLTFDWSLKKNKKASHVGMEYYRLYSEYKDNHQELNLIANAIKKCLPLIQKTFFTSQVESEVFKEGILLGQLHRYFEKIQANRLKSAFTFSRCSICGIAADHIYNHNNFGFIELHLIIPPVDYEENMHFKKTDFVEVCPNCHRMLHLIRPWKTESELRNILITY